MPLFETDEDLLPFRDEAFRRNPYPNYDVIRRSGDVYKHPMGIYVVTKHEHVSKLLRDRSLSVLQIDFGPASPLHDSMLGQDMPDHTRLRRATMDWFMPEAVQSWTAEARNILERLLDNAIGGHIEAVHDIAYPLTHGLMCQILGVPFDGTTTIREKTFDFGLSLGPGASDEDLGATADAAAWFSSYIRGLMSQKRKTPGEGMLDSLIAKQDTGEMTEAEVIATTFLFFAVGHLDVTYLIVNGLRLIAGNRELAIAYRDEPEIRGRVIDEILRFDTPEQFVSRLTTEPTQIGDVVVPAGEMLLLMIGAANKDPDVFLNPHEFDYRRPSGGKSHLAFSGGIHGCVGQILARAEADLVFETFTQRFSEIQLAGEVEWGHTEFIRAIHKLPLKVTLAHKG